MSKFPDFQVIPRFPDLQDLTPRQYDEMTATILDLSRDVGKMLGGLAALKTFAKIGAESFNAALDLMDLSTPSRHRILYLYMTDSRGIADKHAEYLMKELEELEKENSLLKTLRELYDEILAQKQRSQLKVD